MTTMQYSYSKIFIAGCCFLRCLVCWPESRDGPGRVAAAQQVDALTNIASSQSDEKLTFPWLGTYLGLFECLQWQLELLTTTTDMQCC